MTVRVDGRDVDGEGTVLDLCRREGIEIAALCYDERLGAGGHCRACMVEVDGRVQAACTTPLHDGAVVETDTPRLREYRRDLGELMVAESTPRGRVRAVLESWGVEGKRYGSASPAEEPDASHAIVRIDRAACILCRLCIDACAKIQGQFVFSAASRGAATRLSWGDTDFAATDCVSCGACVSVCPSGAITDVDGCREVASKDETNVRTTCSFCGVGCQLDVRVAGDDVVRVDGADSPVNRGHLCLKGRYSHSFARHPDRLTTPLVRRAGRLEPASWEEAIAAVAEGMTRLGSRVGALSSSRCTNEENYLLQKWMRAGLGSNNVDCCARVCHAPSATGLRHAFGTGAATNSFADIERADLILVCGANPTESHPIVGARVKQAVLRGGTRLLVVDPRRTELAALADVHLQPRPGTNVPLLNALAHVMLEEKLVDADFVSARATGLAGLGAFLADFAPERWEQVTGVPAPLVRKAARLYAGARSPMQLHGLGVTEHFQGSESVMLLCNLAVLAGAVGREGTGVNPLRGQNNVQGAADMGCQPDMMTGYAPVASAEERARFEALWGRSLPAEPGLTIPAMYEAIDRGELAGLFVFGEDIVQTDPDSDRVRERLSKLELLVVQELFLSETAELAHVVLPGASALEKDGTFTNAERRVQRVRRALIPPGDARADWQILIDLMRSTGLDVPYEGPADIFEEISRAWPALAAASYASIDAQGLQWPVTQAAPSGTQILHRGRFANGRARLACVPYLPSPSAEDEDFPLTLITGRVLEHYNSGSMTRRSGAASIVDRDWLEIHPGDASVRGIKDGDAVEIEGRSGRARATARLDDTLLRGTAFVSFHFPESATNNVTSQVVDRLSGCPEYKVTRVEIRRV
jgi:formate dehydrogenase major subunit